MSVPKAAAGNGCGTEAPPILEHDSTLHDELDALHFGYV
jgi:hypothetical protein